MDQLFSNVRALAIEAVTGADIHAICDVAKALNVGTEDRKKLLQLMGEYDRFDE